MRGTLLAMSENLAGPRRLVNVGIRVHADTLAEFDAMCSSPDVDSDRSKEIRRLMRESVAEYKARENGRAA